MKMSRLAEIKYEALTARQKEVYDYLIKSEGEVSGEYAIWLKLPELCFNLKRTNDYMKETCGIRPALMQMIILIVARKMNCRFLFGKHAALAIKAGAALKEIEAINHNDRVIFKNEADQAIFDIAVVLAEQKLVPDELFEKCMKLMGRDPTTAASVLIGQYVMSAMLLNAYDLPAPEGSVALA
jgi:4-carboxymuconolactone decarboxylase